MLQRCITNGVMFHQAKVTNEVNSIVAEAIVRYLGSSNGLRGGHQLSAEVWRDLWPVERPRQREFFCFGMDILLKLDLEATRRFFDAFFDLAWILVFETVSPGNCCFLGCLSSRTLLIDRDLRL